MKWISVEERLPNDGEWVLIYHIDYELVHEAKYNAEDKIWITCGICDEQEWDEEVTHWMPLPPKPD